MKNKHGFTLVELLAVLVIIGTISAIAFTSIGGVMEREKTKEYESKCDMFLAKAEEYFNDNKNNIDMSETNPEFTLNALVEAGYTKNNIVNPKTNSNFDLDQTTFNVSQEESGKYYFNKIYNNETAIWEEIPYEDWCDKR